MSIKIQTLWQKIPIMVRAIAVGFVVQTIGFFILILILPANMKYMPQIPWSLAPLGLAFWCYWSYLGGKGWPAKSSDLRQHYRRFNPVARNQKVAVLIAGSLFAGCLFCIAILQNALIEMPPFRLLWRGPFLLGQRRK